MIQQTRVDRLLGGYRNKPPADRDAIAFALVQVSALVASHPEVREIDINPLLADETGVIALDARVRVARSFQYARPPFAIRPYPAAWEKRDTLSGFESILLRPIRPADEHLYAALIAKQTPDDLRMRFLTPNPDLSHKLIARLTQIDYAREMAFVAIGQTSGELLGISRLSADPEYERAEFALVVRSDLKRRGLGRRLLQHLIDYASSEGLKELYGSVFKENAAMLRLCAELGFARTVDTDAANLWSVKLVLPAQNK